MPRVVPIREISEPRFITELIKVSDYSEKFLSELYDSVSRQTELYTVYALIHVGIYLVISVEREEYDRIMEKKAKRPQLSPGVRRMKIKRDPITHKPVPDLGKRPG